jgi:hypothetical protein
MRSSDPQIFSDHLQAKNSNLMPTERKLQKSQLFSDPQREEKS